MFVYGCKRVFRYISLMNHTILEYTFETILKELDVTFEDFQTICMLAGTDYNKTDNNRTVFYYYKRLQKDEMNTLDINYNELQEIRKLFDIDHNLTDFEVNNDTPIKYKVLYSILEKDNFIITENDKLKNVE